MENVYQNPPPVEEENHENIEKSALESLEAELEASRQEIQRLSSLIRSRDEADREAAGFAELFPDVNRDDIPDSVREDAQRQGLPLIAAYALYARRMELAGIVAERAGKSAAEHSAGGVSGSSGTEDFFTLDQIRAMTPKEVRKNYKTILKSIGKIK